MKKIVLILSILLLPYLSWAQQTKEISPARVYDLIREGSGLWLIDVRPSAAFERMHIEGSMNIPAARLAKMILPENTLLVLIDNRLGQLQARNSAQQLRDKGKSRVFVLSGGLGAWRNAELPFISAAGRAELTLIYPEELRAARENGIALNLIDLRDAAAVEKFPLPGAELPVGKTFAERLRVMTKMIRQKPGSLGNDLVAAPVTVVVLPVGISGRHFSQQYLSGLSGDIRVLEGAYLADKVGERIVSGCASCPGN